MTKAYCMLVAKELGVAERQVRAVEELLSEGATVPFIARYRKERTGSLDEVAITIARDRLAQLDELDKRPRPRALTFLQHPATLAAAGLAPVVLGEVEKPWWRRTFRKGLPARKLDRPPQPFVDEFQQLGIGQT